MTTSDMAKITNQEIESLADYPTLLASGYTAEQIHTIRKTVGADVKNMSELALFLTVAKQYKLDPLAREICMIAFKGKNSVFCTRD